jgi:hypothetical protein
MAIHIGRREFIATLSSVASSVAARGKCAAERAHAEDRRADGLC